jgi:hypothetical protein
MTELIRITDDDEPTSLPPLTPETALAWRITLHTRLNRLYYKTPTILADTAKVQTEIGNIKAQLSSPPQREQPCINVMQPPKMPEVPCMMPAENKLAVASRLKNCGKPASVPAIVPTVDHMQRSAVDALVCPECFGRLAIGKQCLSFMQNPKPMSSLEIKQLLDAGGFDTTEKDFMSKHEGEEFYFIGGRLSCKKAEEGPAVVVESQSGGIP